MNKAAHTLISFKLMVYFCCWLVCIRSLYAIRQNVNEFRKQRYVVVLPQRVPRPPSQGTRKIYKQIANYLFKLPYSFTFFGKGAHRRRAHETKKQKKEEKKMKGRTTTQQRAEQTEPNGGRQELRVNRNGKKNNI